MSQLVVAATTLVSSIPLTQRIQEIMVEKGKEYYTMRAMAGRTGIDRETLRNMLKGNREIYTFELEKIAKDLKISVKRITQEDILNINTELLFLFNTLSDNKKALELALTLLEVALGDTERCDAHTFVGRAYFELREYELAHHHRVKAYEFAMKLQEKNGESERLHETLKFLLASFTLRKDYENARAIMEKARTQFIDHPMRLGFLAYSLGNIAYDLGHFEQARDELMVALEYFIKTENTKEIGRAIHNVAFLEYKLGNYSRSKELFESAIDTLQTFVEPRLISIKDYAKVLIKLGEDQKARGIIEKAFNDLNMIDNDLLKSKYYLLRAISMNDPNSAKAVLSSETSTTQLKLLACKILMKHYSEIDDALSVMKYYKRMEMFLNTSTLVDEGDL